jgi:dTDP-4-amino-4,6-dideoxygalactose transaminase
VILEEAIINRIALRKKPKVIIVVHLYGMPFNVEAIMVVAHKYQIPVLEDSAEALGSCCKNQKAGAFGTIGILSFNEKKINTTSGGGAIVSKTSKIRGKGGIPRYPF